MGELLAALLCRQQRHKRLGVTAVDHHNEDSRALNTRHGPRRSSTIEQTCLFQNTSFLYLLGLALFGLFGMGKQGGPSITGVGGRPGRWPTPCRTRGSGRRTVLKCCTRNLYQSLDTNNEMVHQILPTTRAHAD